MGQTPRGVDGETKGLVGGLPSLSRRRVSEVEVPPGLDKTCLLRLDMRHRVDRKLAGEVLSLIRGGNWWDSQRCLTLTAVLVVNS